MLRRDGSVINTVPLPVAEENIFGVIDDDQLVLLNYEASVSWLPLRPGAAPYSPEITLTDELFSSIVVPPMASK